MSVFFRSHTPPSTNEIVRSCIREIDAAMDQRDANLEELIRKAKECSKQYKGNFDPGLRQELKGRVDALRWQAGVLKAEYSTELLNERLKSLEGQLLAWRKEHLWFLPNSEQVDLDVLEELRSYPHLVKRLQGSSELLDRFARWVLVYHCGKEQSIEIFAHYTHLADKIDRCGLIPAIGQYGGLQLKEREISLRKEKLQISIYDEKLQAILKRFEKENHKDTDRDFPYFYGHEGIIEFNRYLHGSDINLNDPDYYKHLPRTNIFLPTEEMQKSIPDPIQKGEWVIIMKAGRRHPNIGVRETHSWIEVYSPTQEGLYELLMSVGLWQKKVPEGNWDYFKITMGSIPGCLAIFEHRSFDRLQQVRAEGFNISHEAGLEFIGQKIRTALIDARSGHLPFQICNHNCLKFAADFTRSAVGVERFNSRITEDQLTRSLFTIDHEPSVQKILSTIQNLPGYLSTLAYWALKTSTGQYQRFTIRERDGQLRQISIAHDSLFSRTDRLYLPSHFIDSK